MKLRKIQKVLQGEYITRYDIQYETKSGSRKNYEMISRSPDIRQPEDLHGSKADAVIMIIHDQTGNKILLNREYRMAVGEWVYNFPAGLIDAGETVAESAARELREETGLQLERISEEWRESYSAVGFSNEKGIVIVGIAAGAMQPSDSEMEEIEARWYSKAEIRDLLLSDARFAARTQAYCVLWSKQSGVV